MSRKPSAIKDCGELGLSGLTQPYKIITIINLYNNKSIIPSRNRAPSVPHFLLPGAVPSPSLPKEAQFAQPQVSPLIKPTCLLLPFPALAHRWESCQRLAWTPGLGESRSWPLCKGLKPGCHLPPSPQTQRQHLGAPWALGRTSADASLTPLDYGEQSLTPHRSSIKMGGPRRGHRMASGSGLREDTQPVLPNPAGINCDLLSTCPQPLRALAPAGEPPSPGRSPASAHTLAASSEPWTPSLGPRPLPGLIT